MRAYNHRISLSRVDLDLIPDKRLMQYSIRLDDGHRVVLKPHMKVSKGGIVDKAHPVLFALLYVDTGPRHILRAFSRVGRSSTAAASTVDGSGVCDWFVTTSIIRLRKRRIKEHELRNVGELQAGLQRRIR